jgi:stage V sporulation protein R
MDTLSELEKWDERIREKAADFGLDCYPQHFEVCDHNQMLGYMAYSGMPSHYPHWSYGKSYEKLKTLYDYGVSGLPYEMVINSNPALAYLMRDNTLLLNVLTVAHVYGHNDFFKNNFTFLSTRAEFTIDTFKAHGDRIRAYVEDPSIGLEKVEALLDAAHALSLQCRRNLSIRKRSDQELLQDTIDAAQPPSDPYQNIHRRKPREEVNLHKVPLVPDEDILLFIRDHNRQMAGWEKDILTIVHEEAQYFIPQIETKIMNEGWASYWHKQILDSLRLPQDLQLEFIVRHNQVIRPHPRGINPYHIGFRVWEDLRRRYDDPEPEELEEIGASHKTGLEKIFEVRETDRDVSFLRRHLTEKLMRDLHLFEYQTTGEEEVVRNVSDEDGWRNVKNTLLKNIGMNTVPVIKVEDADFGYGRTLYLMHIHDGRDLQIDYAEKTLAHLNKLWRYDVALETFFENRRCLMMYNDRGFSTKSLR